MPKQKKITTALFADISGFTSFSEQNKTEIVQKLLETFYSISNDIANCNNGSFTEITGDEVSLHFDDPTNALKAAKELRFAFKDILKQHNLDIRMGIHTGEAIFWNVKIENRLLPYVTGNVQVITARLEKQASKGKIAISKETFSIINNSNTNNLPTKTLKGKGLSQKIKYIEI